MGRSRTFPKENQKKLNQTIRELKAQILKLQKENIFLSSEIDNLVKPARVRKSHVNDSPEQWRVNFIKKFKKDVLGE
jgi:cell division protein FtsB